MRRLLETTALAVVLAVGTSTVATAQVVIDNSKGVDPRVNYRELDRLGPWDDRNYALTREDLALLADNEHELSEGIPAFYRVELRRAHPELLRTGPVQYPRSALPRFLVQYRGYLVDGAYYRGMTRAGGRFIVLIQNQVGDEEDGVGRFLSGEVRVTSPNDAAESAVAINPVDTDLVIAGSNGPGSGQKMHYSTDGGESWSQSAALPGGQTCCDPTVDWSSDGSFGYAATLTSGAPGDGIWFYRSSDDGQTWADLPAGPDGNRRGLGAGNSDKEYLHVDRFATSPHKDNIYLTWHEGNVMQFARSTDSGESWASQSFSSAANMRGIGSDIATDKSGNVYYFWAAFNSPPRIWVRKSTDGGVSFDPAVEVDRTNAAFIFPIPSMETREVFVYASAAADLTNGTYADSLYVAWTDTTGPESGTPANNHARIQVAYSRDGGATWTTVTPHETADANTVDRWHQWIAVAPDGSVHVVFYDTRIGARTSVDLFHSFSTDGGQTYSAPERLTTEVSPNISDGFEFGDYNGLDIVMNNLIAIYTDNRIEGGGSGDSVDVYAIGDAAGAGEADLAIAKVDGVATVDPGGMTTYTITATNNGPDAVTGASVTDVFPFPNGLVCTWTCAPTGGATCTAGPVAGHIMDTADLPSGDSAVYTAVCDVSEFASGSISNTATISGGPFDPTPGNDSATDVDTVNPPPACTLPDDDLSFDNDTVDGTEVHEACNSITAGPAYDVSDTGDLTFAVRGFITLEDGFSVDEDGVFVAINDPFLNP